MVRYTLHVLWSEKKKLDNMQAVAGCVIAVLSLLPTNSYERKVLSSVLVVVVIVLLGRNPQGVCKSACGQGVSLYEGCR